jgi:hypothetical protein
VFGFVYHHHKADYMKTKQTKDLPHNPRDKEVKNMLVFQSTSLDMAYLDLPQVE